MVEAAIRQYEYDVTPEKEAARIKRADLLQQLVKPGGEVETLRAQLAKAHALLSKACTDLLHIQKECSGDVTPGYIGCLVDDVVDLLSASAEPSAQQRTAGSDYFETAFGSEPSAPFEIDALQVIAQSEGVLTFMRNDSSACVCCKGNHVYCRYFAGMPSFGDLTEAARFRADLEGRTFRFVVQLLPDSADQGRKP